MTVTTNGNYKRSSGYVEVEVSKCDKYSDVTRKIAATFEVEVEANELLALFKIKGTRILNKELTVNSKNNHG